MDLFDRRTVTPTRVININAVTQTGLHPYYDVYIGRQGHGFTGYFGNPFRIGGPCPRCGRPMSRGVVLRMFEAYARQRALLDSDYYERVKKLHGKTLGCFCAPKACHGDTLAVLAALMHREPRPPEPERVVSLLTGEVVDPGKALEDIYYIVGCNDANPSPL